MKFVDPMKKHRMDDPKTRQRLFQTVLENLSLLTDEARGFNHLTGDVTRLNFREKNYLVDTMVELLKIISRPDSRDELVIEAAVQQIRERYQNEM